MSSDDESLLAKIRVLLDATHYDEFLLVVLVLLTRVEDPDKVQQVWTKGRDTIEDFCCRLENKPQYLHIVARLVSRLQNGGVGVDLFQVLLNALSERVTNTAPCSTFDVDLILALNASMPETRVNEVTDKVWNRFHQVQVENSVRGKMNDTVTTDTSAANDRADWKLVHDTIDALLTADENGFEISLQRAVLVMFFTHGPNACSSTLIPLWYKPMALWVARTEQGPVSSVVPQWHCVVLQCTRELTFQLPQELQKRLLQSKDLSSVLVQLILCYISSSPQQIDSNLVSLAWSTVASLSEAFCVDWMMLPGSGALGNATTFCTILRLATGEWRIQLGRLCVDEASESATQIVDSCGRVIAANLQHVMHLVERKREKFQIQGAALLHLRDSLQDALHATVEYLCQTPQGPQQAQAVAGQVLGGLLMEFDVWDGLPNGISTDETLQALGVALHSNHANPGSLLPSLVMVLASVEEVEYCVKYLDKHHLLGNTLVSFLVAFWENVAASDASQCPAACQVAELWYSLSAPPLTISAQLRRAIHKWIQREVKSPTPNVQALTSAVDCYVMLFGQDAPSEREASVVQQAIKICEKHQST